MIQLLNMHHPLDTMVSTYLLNYQNNTSKTINFKSEWFMERSVAEGGNRKCTYSVDPVNI